MSDFQIQYRALSLRTEDGHTSVPSAHVVLGDRTVAEFVPDDSDKGDEGDDVLDAVRAKARAFLDSARAYERGLADDDEEVDDSAEGEADGYLAQARTRALRYVKSHKLFAGLVLLQITVSVILWFAASFAPDVGRLVTYLFGDGVLAPVIFWFIAPHIVVTCPVLAAIGLASHIDDVTREKPPSPAVSRVVLTKDEANSHFRGRAFPTTSGPYRLLRRLLIVTNGHNALLLPEVLVVDTDNRLAEAFRLDDGEMDDLAPEVAGHLLLVRARMWATERQEGEQEIDERDE